jgi:hypothetical protein
MSKTPTLLAEGPALRNQIASSRRLAIKLVETGSSLRGRGIAIMDVRSTRNFSANSFERRLKPTEMVSALMTDLLARLKNVGPSGEGWTARCPAHEDNRNSLSIHHCNGRWLLYCHAGCGWRAIINCIGIQPADLFDVKWRAGD